MAFRIRRKKNVNVMRAGVKIVSTVIGLYAAGFLLTVMGNIMNGTASPFYTGLKLIGWTIATVTNSSDGITAACGNNAVAEGGSGQSISNCVTATNGTGILSVVGLLAIIWIVFEFIDVQM